jgi:hypothetical protein
VQIRKVNTVPPLHSNLQPTAGQKKKYCGLGTGQQRGMVNMSQALRLIPSTNKQNKFFLLFPEQ